MEFHDQNGSETQFGAFPDRAPVYQSILFLHSSDQTADRRPCNPEIFTDLHFDSILSALTEGREDYDLTPYFFMPLHDDDAVGFRHEIFRDLEDRSLFAAICAFANGMSQVRGRLAETRKTYSQHQIERWLLDAADLYGETILHLAHVLNRSNLSSRGLRAFRDYIGQYTTSEHFLALQDQTKQLDLELSALRYCIAIQGLHVSISEYKEQADYSVEIECIFKRFRQGDVDAHVFKFDEAPRMNHIEEKILDLVAQQYSQIFLGLEQFRADHESFMDDGIATFDREVQFYVSYLNHIAPLKDGGLSFCIPDIVDGDQKKVYARRSFDLALAGKMAGNHAALVVNDFYLNGSERIMVVSGPNQGGKTTFARMFGQLHYLASLGYPVPGTEARLYLCDRVFTHFEKEERMTSLRGKLEDDLIRIHAILAAATGHSIVVINEIFSSTALWDAVDLSKRIGKTLIDLGSLGVWVTFIEEVALLGPQTVGMSSTVAPENPATRTFRIVRKAPDGLAYAMSLAEKHRLTYAIIKNRIAS